MTARAAGLRGLAARAWDVVVVGAGPAGCVAARACALAGRATLLVERAALPRPKICGGTINRAAEAALAAAGLADLLDRVGAGRLEVLDLRAGRATARLTLPGLRVVGRDVLDATLAHEAERAGAALLTGVRASLGALAGDARVVELATGAARAAVTASVVVDASGLGGLALPGETAGPSRAGDGDWFGAGALVPAADWPDRVLGMAVGRGAYVGLARLPDGQVDVAAAVDRAVARAEGGPAGVVARVLAGAGLGAVLAAGGGSWRGAPAFSRRGPEAWAPRLLRVGDAAGYVEPFTGEGIAWALLGALAAAPLACEAAERWDDSIGRRWRAARAALLGRRQHACRVVRWAAHRPAVAGLATLALSVVPGLAAPLLRGINRAPALASPGRPP